MKRLLRALVWKATDRPLLWVFMHGPRRLRRPTQRLAFWIAGGKPRVVAK